MRKQFKATGLVKKHAKASSLVMACAIALGVTACGGGGGGSDAPSGTATTNVPVTVVDGPIRNATVCIDKNANGACDSGETAGTTDAAGNVTLAVPTADVGKYAILAMVGTGAVDADHGAITTPYTMVAPADQPALVSPLTTLVQTIVAATGASTADAEAAVRAQTGLNVSMFHDFSKSSTAESQAAAGFARMLVAVTQKQSELIKASLGTLAFDGKTITQADLDIAIRKRLLEMVPTLLAALNDPLVTDATDAAAREAAMQVKAQTIVTSSIGLTTASVATIVAINNQVASPPAATIEATSSLGQFTFSGAANWFLRTYNATLAQNTPDAAGRTRYIDYRARKSGTETAYWNNGSDPGHQSDLHYNGSAWVPCGLNQEGISSGRDATGSFDYDFCDKAETGRQSRATFDVSGRGMNDVYQQIRTAGYTNLTVASPLSMLGNATFPTGSKMYFLTSNAFTEAPTYYPGGNSYVQQASAAVAAGKTSTADDTSACAAVTPATPFASYLSTSTTLEGMAARSPGMPCNYAPSNATVNPGSGNITVPSGSRNEWWGATTQLMGVVGTAFTGGAQSSYYTANTLLRVGFGAGNVAKYYSCRQRSTDGSPRNCDNIGTGTYTITTMADGRVMKLNNLPFQTTNLNYERVFVERGGKVFMGYQNRTTSYPAARLNLAATNAMLAQLGVPVVDPAALVVLSKASYAGEWRFYAASEGDDNGSRSLRIGNDGSAFCLESNNVGFNVVISCGLTLTNPATGAFTLSLPDGSLSGNLAFMTGAVTGTFTPAPTGAAVTIAGSRR